jgi:chorismate synthase
VPRAVVVVEAMTALTIADLLLMNMSSKLENVKKVYSNK